MHIHGKEVEDVVVVEKILRSMTPKFSYVIYSIKELKDLNEFSINKMLVHK